MASRIYQVMVPKTIRFGVDATHTLRDEVSKLEVKKALIILGFTKLA